MRTVWKFPVTVDDETVITMPVNAQVLSIAIQNGAPCLWALVDPNGRAEERRFFWLGTGHPVGGRNLGSFVGTVLMQGGALVFHLFEEFKATLANG